MSPGEIEMVEGTEVKTIPILRRCFYDTYANLPTSGINVEDLGYATDMLTLYRWSGTAWQAVTQGTIVRKTANETVNNSTVLQDDDHLFFPILANEIWDFLILLKVQIKAASDFKFTITAPAGAGGGFNKVHLLVTSGYCPVPTSFGADDGVIDAVDRTIYCWVIGIVENGANAGNIRVQWAQQTAVAENTVVEANSFLTARRLKA